MVLVYIGCTWDSVCEPILQKILDYYADINQSKRLLEVIYITADREKEKFYESLKKTPFLTVPY